MIYPRYPAYKDSGAEWLGEIPSHWEAVAVRRHFAVDLGKMLNLSKQDGSGAPKPYLRAANIHWDRLDLSDVNTMEFSDSQLERYRLQPGDLLVTEGGVTVGRSAIWNGEFAECYYQNSLNRARVLPGSPLTTRYLLYWMHFTTACGFVDLVAEKATFGHLTNEKLMAFPLVAPPNEHEQATIVTFLDHETAKIDTLIAKQEQLIALLQEKRQALISHAVTKGLNTGAPMKESGAAWLGKIPAHWDVKPLKHLADVRGGVAKGRDLSGQDTIDVPYLRVANVQDGYLDLTDVALITIARTELARYALQPGDVLMNEGGDNDKLGRGHVWNGEIDSCIHQNHVFAVRCHAVEPGWLTAVTSTSYAKTYFQSRAKQSTNLASISSSNLQELPVVLPPDTERQVILRHVNNEWQKIDALMAKVQAAIGKLQERRIALISAAVTGKIDVRGEEAML
jgi:type I restriction enzyme S subunit